MWPTWWGPAPCCASPPPSAPCCASPSAADRPPSSFPVSRAEQQTTLSCPEATFSPSLQPPELISSHKEQTNPPLSNAPLDTCPPCHASPAPALPLRPAVNFPTSPLYSCPACLRANCISLALLYLPHRFTITARHRLSMRPLPTPSYSPCLHQFSARQGAGRAVHRERHVWYGRLGGQKSAGEKGGTLSRTG